MELILDGIKIEVTRKKMKDLRIRVTSPEAKVLVSAPMSMSSKEIESCIKEKLDWIQSSVQKVRSSEAPVKKSEEQRLFDLQKRLRELLSEPKYSDSLDRKAAEAALKGELSADKTAEIILAAKLSVFIPLWEKKTEFYCSSWKIKKVKSYWGKCNFITRELFFCLRLAEQDNDYIEYVVLHELAHIKYHDHGKEFKAFLSKHMPEWRTTRKKLKMT